VSATFDAKEEVRRWNERRDRIAAETSVSGRVGGWHAAISATDDGADASAGHSGWGRFPSDAAPMVAALRADLAAAAGRLGPGAAKKIAAKLAELEAAHVPGFRCRVTAEGRMRG
jgi:hypothetical protein